MRRMFDIPILCRALDDDNDALVERQNSGWRFIDYTASGDCYFNFFYFAKSSKMLEK